ncbi:MAG: hypothetical protein LBI19_02445 [Oscillospiraceae bacterium]|jgi:hypothetical protein|nr:hypothetical protein [Oscillospiraceae bacterium]
MNKRSLYNAFDALAPTNAASERMLHNILQGEEPEMHPVTRFVAITLSTLVLFAGVALMWRHMDGFVPPIIPAAVETPETSASPDPAREDLFTPTSGALHTELVPYTERETVYDLDFENISLSDDGELRLEQAGFRVYRDGLTAYLVRPDMTARILFEGFTRGLEISPDASYLIYTHSTDPVLKCDTIAVEFLDDSGRAWRSRIVIADGLGKDIKIHPLGGDRWAVYDAEPFYSSHMVLEDTLLAVLTVAPDGVWVEVMDENGFQLIH